MKVLLIVLAVVAGKAHARKCESGGDRIPAVYFGGYKSTDTQAQEWAAAARCESPYGQSFSFEGHSLHQAASNEAAVLAAEKAEINAYVRKINSADFKGPIVLIGHSDGGWVIREIAKKVSAKNRHKIKLVSLDGYAINGPAFEDVDVQCWTAYSVEKQATPPKMCSQISAASKSLYTHEMKKCKKDSCHFLPQRGCASNWCLHFRLANKNVAANVGNANYDSIGYRDVNPPLLYLKKYLGSSHAQAVPPHSHQEEGGDGFLSDDATN